MNFISFAFMCLVIGSFLYFDIKAADVPELLWKINFWISWVFIVWACYISGRVIIDCIMLNSQGQMTSSNVFSSMLLAVLNVLPTIAMSVFMLKEGFK